jgi:hypothetical protein
MLAAPGGEVAMVNDIRFTDHGSVVRVEALTPAGEEWLEENVEAPESWAGSRFNFCGDRRMIFEIFEGVQGSGLNVEVSR